MITASCGHKVEFDQEVEISFADYGWGEDRAVCYGSYCPKCAEQMKKSSDYLPTREDELRWLNEGVLPNKDAK